MYTIYIVDDSSNTRSGLKELFKWDKLNIKIIGDADDGSTALPEIIQNKPDIVLTDVKMPIMSGIELSKRIRSTLPKTEIIFMSGYDEVTYIKSALKLEAIDYIFKPLDFDELELTLKKVITKIDGERTQSRIISEMDAKLIQSMPLLKDKFFELLILGSFNDKEEIFNRSKFLGIDMPDGKYSVMVISEDNNYNSMSGKNVKDRLLLSFGILNIITELINSSFIGYTFEKNPGEYVCIININDIYTGDSLYNLASDMQHKLAQFLEVSVTIGISGEAKSLLELKTVYEAASDAARKRFYCGKNKIIVADILMQSDTTITASNKDNMNEFAESIKEGDSSQMWSIIDSIFNNMNETTGYEECCDICLQLIAVSAGIQSEFEITLPDKEYSMVNVIHTLFKLETLSDIKQYLLTYFRKICRLVIEKRENKSKNVIEIIKNIINKRYNENLSINMIANEVYLTPTYICLLFRQETGYTINNYITKVRMEKAKELLKKINIKLYDISSHVGYENPSYFSKQFKKYTGMSPREYRNKML